mmetsp:Transcript_10949/g.16618  ORF Transcript_10949/g.16618 Transcript_10949/m.16618 type:complete len:96 (-) Transcript_10949:517-804(-)
MIGQSFIGLTIILVLANMMILAVDFFGPIQHWVNRRRLISALKEADEKRRTEVKMRKKIAKREARKKTKSDKDFLDKLCPPSEISIVIDTSTIHL